MGLPNTDNVEVLEGSVVTGAIFIAPTTVALPTDATTALSSDYKCFGFTSDEGFSITEETSNNELRAWEGHAVVRNTRTEYSETIAFTPIECNAEVAKATWGDSYVDVDAGGNLTIRHHGQAMPAVHVVIECVPFAGAVKRYCAKAQLTERGDMTGNGQDFAGRQLSFKTLALSDGSTMVEYLAFTGDTPEPPEPTLYTITVAETTYGTVSASAEQAAEGATVSFTMTPESGYNVDGAEVQKAVGTCELSGTPEDGYTFTMPAENVTILVTFAAG